MVPLTMMEFFRKSEGTWFTQRSVHHFDLVGDQSGESNLTIQVLEQTDPAVLAVCQQQAIDPVLAKGGARFIWQDNQDDREPNPDAAAVIIDVPDPDCATAGKLLRDRGYIEQIPVVSRYWLGPDGILTIDTEYDKNQGQERCWFLTDDFRVRVSTVRTLNGVYLMTYCSERRCVSDQTLKAMVDHNLARAEP
jgi:CpeS-like protein